jgi:hypothetical protein
MRKTWKCAASEWRTQTDDVNEKETLGFLYSHSPSSIQPISDNLNNNYLCFKIYYYGRL